MAITLTDSEAKILLETFDGYDFGALRRNPELLGAVMKLHGTCVEEEWVLRSTGEGIHSHKVEMIKAIRHMLGLGLKEAKDYVEGSHGRANGDVVVKASACVHCQGDIATARSILRDYNINVLRES